ncbi:tautomerase family protein [Acidovorax sp. DW039]|uniref:tautomerase family protein n=1 Tax=Acidovorax sp. DW039 TaxID=3095606 RepID=UPI00308C1D91|nr:tautomerase family protein [Acidovorax sp. DW039]
MPTLVLKLTPLQNPERYRQLAVALTDLTVRVLGKRREVTAVVIDDLPAARWHIGAESVQQPTALLEISITAGTNTAEEKAAYVQAAYAELERQLTAGGTLAQASYVIVRELPASDWGYGGRTQLARKQALQVA